eukprot:5003319-Amphidinium_carterae.1
MAVVAAAAPVGAAHAAVVGAADVDVKLMLHSVHAVVGVVAADAALVVAAYIVVAAAAHLVAVLFAALC